MAEKISDNGVVRDMTSEEKAEIAVSDEQLALDKLNDLRRHRTFMLKETDWMSASDLTMDNNWKTYRQELRDITKTYKSISDSGFKWPTKPKE